MKSSNVSQSIQVECQGPHFATTNTNECYKNMNFIFAQVMLCWDHTNHSIFHVKVAQFYAGVRGIATQLSNLSPATFWMNIWKPFFPGCYQQSAGKKMISCFYRKIKPCKYRIGSDAGA